MIGRLLSLFALVALLAMPVSPAAAQAAPTAPAMATAMAGHCSPERMGETDKSLPGSHCGAACALLLPQPARVRLQSRPARIAPPMVMVAGLGDRAIALATPPPKRG